MGYSDISVVPPSQKLLRGYPNDKDGNECGEGFGVQDAVLRPQVLDVVHDSAVFLFGHDGVGHRPRIKCIILHGTPVPTRGGQRMIQRLSPVQGDGVMTC